MDNGTGITPVMPIGSGYGDGFGAVRAMRHRHRTFNDFHPCAFRDGHDLGRAEFRSVYGDGERTRSVCVISGVISLVIERRRNCACVGSRVG